MRGLVWLFVLGCGTDDPSDVETDGPDGEGPGEPADTDDPEEPDDTDRPDTGVAGCEHRGWGRDGDGDGFATGVEAWACEPPAPGWVDAFGDCDDADPNVTTSSTWYLDRDGDGWGDERRAVTDCVQPTNYAAASGDCNERDSAMNPGATDVCPYDRFDEDCDGGPSWYVDEDGDGYGVDEVRTCDQPRAAERGDCDDTDTALNPGAQEICADGIDQDCDGNAGPCGVQGVWSVGWDSPDLSVASAYAVGGDLDGDGAADLLLWSHYGEQLLVQAGPFERAPREDADAVLVVIPRSEETDIGRGRLFDVDGDGRDELVVGERRGASRQVWIEADRKSGTTNGTGAEVLFAGADLVGMAIDSDGDGAEEIALDDGEDVWLVEDPPNGTWSADDHAQAWHDRTGLTDLGDTDGDGLSDLAWSAFTSDVNVTEGPLRGEIAADHVIARGTHGLQVVPSAVGDLDGDGRRDLAVRVDGAATRDHCGEWVDRTVFIDFAPFGADLDAAEGSLTSWELGLVAEAGDLDADGLPELFVDQSTGCDTSPGQTWVLTGPYEGVLSAPERALAEMKWPQYPPMRPTGVVAADLDGDGIGDLAVSVFLRSYLFFGGPGG